jgi:predicted enzyme related to lactoylglutathione lyase
MFYVEVDDIPKYLSKADSIGGKQVTPKTEIPNVGWFGVLADPDGNKIGVYTSLPK